jgi:hypothetical protein
MASPDPENVAQLSTAALMLSQSLERELAHAVGGRVKPGVREVYDVVYLPRLIALSYQAKRYVEFEDWQLLCQPLHPDLADAQLGIVIELLHSLVMAF